MDAIMLKTLAKGVVVFSIIIYFVGWYDLGEPPSLARIGLCWLLVFTVIGIWGRLRKKGPVR